MGSHKRGNVRGLLLVIGLGPWLNFANLVGNFGATDRRTRSLYGGDVLCSDLRGVNLTRPEAALLDPSRVKKRRDGQA